MPIQGARSDASPNTRRRPRISRAASLAIVRAHMPTVAPTEWDAAVGFVRHLGACLALELEQHGASPTFRDERERLGEIADMGQRLARLVRAVSAEAGLVPDLARRRPAARGAEASLPDNLTMAFALTMEGFSPGQHPLELLAAAARRREAALRRAASGAGRQRLYSRLNGDPRLSLAEGCAGLLLRFCGPRAAPATADGPVFRLACAIWTAATGTDPEEANLDRFVKQGANQAKKRALPP